MKRIGFTGTRAGMTAKQKLALHGLLEQADEDAYGIEFHHGGAPGADKESHDTVRMMKSMITGATNIVVHPAIDGGRNWFGAKIVHDPKPPLIRNHDIVDETEILIATPRRTHEELRSGTWATIRYARKVGREVYIIWPDGSIQSGEAK